MVVEQGVSVTGQDLWLTLINDFQGRNVPVLKLAIGELDVKANDWSAALRASVVSSLSADILNEDIMTAEPLIEHWPFRVTLDTRAADETDAAVPQQSVVLAAERPFNVNVSHGALNGLSRTLSSLSEDWQGGANKRSAVDKVAQSTVIPLLKSGCEGGADGADGADDDARLAAHTADDAADVFHGSWVLNKTGLDAKGICRFRPRGVEADHDVKLFELRNGECVPVTLGDGTVAAADVSVPVRVCKIIVGDEGIDGVTVDQIGTRLHPLVHCSPVVSDVAWNDDGTKLTTLRSTVMLRNNTNKLLRAIFVPQQQQKQQQEQQQQQQHAAPFFLHIPVGASEPVPLPHILSSALCVQLFDDEDTPFTGHSDQSVPASAFYTEGKTVLTLPRLTAGTTRREDVFVTMGIELDRSTFAGDGFALSTISFNAPFSFTNTLACTADFCVSEISPKQKQKMLQAAARKSHHQQPQKQQQLAEVAGAGAAEAEEENKKVPVFEGDLDLRLASGETHTTYRIDPRKTVYVTLSGLHNFRAATLELRAESSETHLRKLKMVDGNGFKLDLQVEVSVRPTREHVFFAPFWLINKTNVPLLYQVGSRPLAGMGLVPFDVVPHEPSHGRVGDEREAACAPFMCSSNTLCVRTPTGAASNAFQFDTIGSTGVAEFVDPAPARLYSLKVSCYLGTGVYARTKMVTFCPHHVLVNQLPGCTVVVKQDDTPGRPFRLPPGAQRSFHWWLPSADCRDIARVPRRATVTVAELDGTHEASGSFTVDEVGSGVLRLRAKPGCADARDRFLHYEVVDAAYTTFILWRAVTTDAAPFRVDNDTRHELRVCQKDVDPAHTAVVRPYSTLDYAWDEPLRTQELCVASALYGSSSPAEQQQQQEHAYAINKLREFAPVCVAPGAPVYVYTIARGACRVLVFTEDEERYKEECKSPRAPDDASKGDQQQQQQQHSSGESKPPAMQVAVKLPGIGINVLTPEPRDFLFLTISNILFRMVQTESELQLEASIGRLQLDNQLLDTDFPVVLAGIPGKNGQPWFRLSAVVATQYESILFVEYFSFLAQEIVVNVETKFIKQILDFVGSLPSFGVSSKTVTEKKEEEDQEEKKDETTTTTTTTMTMTTKTERPKINSIWEYPGEEIVNSETARQQMAYFRLFHLNPLKVVVTLSSSAGSDSVLSLPPSPVTVLLETLLGTVANLDAAPLCFNSLYMENPFVPTSELQARIVQHYIRQGIQQVYKLLGSTEALGNPVGLFTNISTGVMDFFYEPAQGIIESPQAFAKGLAKGTSSLVKNTVYGTFNSVSKVVGALGKGVATLSCDDEYIRRRQANQRRKPKHFVDGAAQGAVALGRGFFDGLTGIVMKPVEGARREGAVGLFKGLGQGVVGAAVKPVAGVLEAVSKTTEGIKNTATMLDADQQLRRVRPSPRRFGAERELLEFDEYACVGYSYLLHDDALRRDTHVLHVPLEPAKKGRVAVLTTAHLALVADTGDHCTYRTRACYALADVQSVSRMHEGLVLSVAVRGRPKLVSLPLTPDDAQQLESKIRSVKQQQQQQQQQQ